MRRSISTLALRAGRTLIGLGPGLALIALGGLACAPVSVTTETMPGADFSRYATYELVFGVAVEAPAPGGGDAAAIDAAEAAEAAGAAGADAAGRGTETSRESERQSVREAIVTALRAKGYREADSPPADLLVGYTVRSAEVVRLVDAGEPDANFERPRNFAAETLAVSASDAGSGELLWRGTAKTETPTSGALVTEDPRKALLEAVRRVMSEFPAARAQDS